MKTGIIDVGGGLRGIYGAGVLDRCMEEGVRFDCCIGVSAGSANMSSYVAGQHGRNKPFYQDYSFRKEYMSVGNLVRKHSYLDLEYVYGALSNRGGENPLDYPAVVRSPAELVIVATEARTGKPRYFTKADLRQDDYRPLMASCCIPVVDQPYFMDGVPYYDGGLADPVPLEKAFALGCDRVAVILTKPSRRSRPVPGTKSWQSCCGTAIRQRQRALHCGPNATTRPCAAPSSWNSRAPCASWRRTAPRAWPP